MSRRTLELDDKYYSKLYKLAKKENRKKVEEIRHLIDQQYCVFIKKRR